MQDEAPFAHAHGEPQSAAKTRLGSSWCGMTGLERSLCILCCGSGFRGLLGGVDSAVLLLLVALCFLGLPETLLEEVDEGLAQVLLCPVAV